MALYEYRCYAGHVNDKFYSMNYRRPKTVQCKTCPRRAKRVFTRAAVRPDFPEHYNWSLGMVIKNRKHHEQIQKERGLQDWQPRRESPMLGRLRKEGFRV